jgi:hypothetical protein
MKKLKDVTYENRQKKIIIFLLYLGTVMIMFLGAFFGAYSVINKIELQVLSTKVPGVAFGLLVVYLGARYFFMVADFKTEFYKSREKFSWSNFKKVKNKGKISGTKKIKLITGR